MAAMLLGAAPLENPPDVRFTLAAKDGRTTFRMGEPVDVELRFRADTPGKYVIAAFPDNRFVRLALFDVFTAEPKDGVADPLGDIPAQLGHGISALPHAVRPLDGNIVSVERQVNEWLSFRKPGRYRITAETTRVRRSDPASRPLRLRSNALEIEIVPPEAGWADRQLASAVAVLERGDPPPPVISQVHDPAPEAQLRRAARILRFLETREAAHALVRFFEHGPAAAQQELRAGLFGSPHRKEVIASMERDLSAPDVPITYYWLGTLIELASAEILPPQPPLPIGDPEAEKRWMEEHGARLERTRPVEQRYFAILAEAIGRKQGRARAVSLGTLLTRGPQPPSPAVLAALFDNFTALPEISQRSLLEHEWYRIASPAAEPLLRSLAASAGGARDAALLRLYELNPKAGRELILRRIRSGDAGSGAQVLMILPDETIPELDEALAGALEQGKPVEALIARYATGAVFGRVRAWYEAKRPACGGPLFAYFFRVDPVYAAAQLAERRRTEPGGCPLYMSPYEHLLASPGLERAAIEDLRHPNPMVRRSAQTLLQYGGSSEAEQPLWDALAAMRAAKFHPLDAGLEFGLVEALLKGAGWVVTPEKIDRLHEACITDQCRTLVAGERRSLEPPVRVSLLPEGPLAAMIGPFRMRTREQIQRKIAQFPRGTSFRLDHSYGGSWFAEQRWKVIRELLEAAGMRTGEGKQRR